jgi:hypothetical protein
MTHDRQCAAIVAPRSSSRGISLETVAEGAENEETMRFSRARLRHGAGIPREPAAECRRRDDLAGARHSNACSQRPRPGPTRQAAQPGTRRPRRASNGTRGEATPRPHQDPTQPRLRPARQPHPTRAAEAGSGRRNDAGSSSDGQIPPQPWRCRRPTGKACRRGGTCSTRRVTRSAPRRLELLVHLHSWKMPIRPL